MNNCIVIIKDVEEAIKLSDIVIKDSPRHKGTWTKDFWQRRFKERQDWAINISYSDSSDTIKDASYCDIPWYLIASSYKDMELLTLEAFLSLEESEPEPQEPFIKNITMEDIYNGNFT